ncbi:MAG: E3 ubiquitin ligase family protein [Raineya sp.]|nr:E3 ubiquitin ligase family protein [Raineya sp.]MDW8295661.1 E3 ubiquitin ligase family protein [Raineya sp.]
MGLVIAGIVCIAIAIGLWFHRKSQLNKSLNIKYQQTTTAKNIWENYEDIVGTVGQGHYSEIVEVKGIAKCDQPLLADHSRKPVVYYKASVIHEYEVQEQQRDSNGNVRWVTRRRSETIASNEQSVPFYIDDGSGKTIAVNPALAEKHTTTSVDRFERELSQGYLNQNRNSHWGMQLINFLSNVNTYGSRTLGYRLVEECIPVNVRLYVYGEANDRDGELTISKPRDENQNFIVSVKSEEELVQAAESSASLSLVGAIALVIIGAILIILGISGN